MVGGVGFDGLCFLGCNLDCLKDFDSRVHEVKKFLEAFSFFIRLEEFFHLMRQSRRHDLD